MNSSTILTRGSPNLPHAQALFVVNQTLASIQDFETCTLRLNQSLHHSSSSGFLQHLHTLLLPHHTSQRRTHSQSMCQSFALSFSSVRSTNASSKYAASHKMFASHSKTYEKLLQKSGRQTAQPNQSMHFFTTYYMAIFHERSPPNVESIQSSSITDTQDPPPLPYR